MFVASGKELKKDSEILRAKLDTKTMFDDWSTKVMNKCKTPNNKLFLVEKLQRDGRVINHLKVNYAPETIVIAKEVWAFMPVIVITQSLYCDFQVRNLKNMGFRLPFKVMSLAHNGPFLS